MLSRIIYLDIHHNIVLNVLGIIRRERIGQLIYYLDLLDMSRPSVKNFLLDVKLITLAPDLLGLK